MRSSSLMFLLPALVSAAGPPPSEIVISSVQNSGNGCPQGSVSTSLSPDGTVVTFGFDSFQTYIGPGTSVADHTKNCQLHLNLRYPSGFSFAVIDATYHGFAQLDQGVTGTFYSTYYFSSNAAATATSTTSISGGGVWANGQVYTKQTSVPASDSVRSGCNGGSAILNINNRIALTSRSSSASGTISDDDATVALTQQLHIQWYPC